MLSKRRRNLVFLEAGILTLCVYFIALLINYSLDDLRINTLEKGLQESSLQSESSKLFQFYLDSQEIFSCDVMKKNIALEARELKNFANDLNNFGFLFSEKNEDVAKIKQREYYISQTELYFEILNYNDVCEDRIIPGLYFFDAFDVTFDRQAVAVESMVLNSQNNSVFFTYDINFEQEPIVEALMDKYEVTFYPFVVLGNMTHHEFGRDLITVERLTAEFKRQRGEIQ